MSGSRDGNLGVLGLQYSLCEICLLIEPEHVVTVFMLLDPWLGLPVLTRTQGDRSVEQRIFAIILNRIYSLNVRNDC